MLTGNQRVLGAVVTEHVEARGAVVLKIVARLPVQAGHHVSRAMVVRQVDEPVAAVRHGRADEEGRVMLGAACGVDALVQVMLDDASPRQGLLRLRFEDRRRGKAQAERVQTLLRGFIVTQVIDETVGSEGKEDLCVRELREDLPDGPHRRVFVTVLVEHEDAATGGVCSLG